MDPNQQPTVPQNPNPPYQPGLGNVPPAPTTPAPVNPQPQAVFGYPPQQPTVPVQPTQPNPYQFPQPEAPGQHYQQSPNPLQLPSQGNKKRILIAVVAVVVIALGAGIYMLTKDGGSLSNVTNKLSGNSDVVSRSDGTLDLGNLIDRNENIKDQDLKAKLKQQVNLSDGTSYMVTSVQRNFTSESYYLKTNPGKELVKLNMVIGNRDKSNEAFILASNFKIRNSAGGLQSPEYVTADDMSDAFISQDIASGKQVKGALVFEVDKDEVISTLHTEDKYTNYTTKKEITVKSEVSLK